MKRFLSLFLCFSLLFVPLAVRAEESELPDISNQIVVAVNKLPEVTEEADGTVTVYGLNFESIQYSPSIDAFLNGSLKVIHFLLIAKDGQNVEEAIKVIKEQNGVLEAVQNFYMSPIIDDETVALGDVNGDGNIDTVDYIIVKRNVLGTYKFDENPDTVDISKVCADVNMNGTVDVVDYIMIKRHIIGSYQIPDLRVNPNGELIEIKFNS